MSVNILNKQTRELEPIAGVPIGKLNLLETKTNNIANDTDVYSDQKSYSVGDYIIYNNVVYKCITACTADTWENNASNFESTTLLGIDNELNNTIDDITDVYGAKNLFNTKGNYTLFSNGSYEDPTFNSDGTIQFGSFSGGSYYGCDFTDNIYFNESIDLIFTSGLTDASDSTAYIEVLYNPSSTIESVRIYNEPVLIEDVRTIDQINLVSRDGQSRLFKPMLRTANIKSDKYVPYAMTNKQLTDSIGTASSNATNAINIAKKSSDAYSSSKAYKVGDYCIYNDQLYKCTTACSAGSWSTNQNCFTADSLTNAVTTLNSDLMPILVATGTDNTSFASQLAELETTFNSLANNRKVRSYIKDSNVIYRLDAMTGVFARTTCSSSNMEITRLNLSGHIRETWKYSSGSWTYTNQSSIVGNSLELYA